MGFGHVNSPGGFRYSLLIIYYKTYKKFIYGMKDVTDDKIHNALLILFIEAGGIPGIIQCDFNGKFLKGPIHKLCMEGGIFIQAAPSGCQSQSGLT
jgi:hypothetical protein